MIERYEHPAITPFFDRDMRMGLWARIEMAWLQARAIEGEAISPEQLAKIASVAVPTANQVDTHEKFYTGHDVVAFLDLWTSRMSDDVAHLVHRGLTSSDVVDTAHFRVLTNVLGVVDHLVHDLMHSLGHLAETSNPRLGRTHGQIAEPTTLTHRAHTWLVSLASARDTLSSTQNVVNVLKSPGATGYGWFFSEGTARRAGEILDCYAIALSTQVIPRVHQFQWASALLQAALICEDIAMEVRLSSRSEINELREGGKRVGSSAMPGKYNPIGAENISGLVRIARGYLSTLAENATLHNDRDISNSSVERVVVEDLSHVVATIVSRTTELVLNLQINSAQMQENLRTEEERALASTYQFLLQTHGKMRSVDANARVAAWMNRTDRNESLVDDLSDEARSEFYGDLSLYMVKMGL